MVQPFPNANVCSVVTCNAVIPDPETLREFQRRVDFAADNFCKGIEDSTPRRHAGVIYIGLCYLRELHEAGDYDTAEKLCKRVYERIAAGQGTGSTINCSHFDTGNGQCPDHYRAIRSAMSLFLPVKHAKKRSCAVLLSIGSRHGEKFEYPGFNTEHAIYKLPEDDSWVNSYLWRPRPINTGK